MFNLMTMTTHSILTNYHGKFISKTHFSLISYHREINGHLYLMYINLYNVNKCVETSASVKLSEKEKRNELLCSFIHK